MSREEVVLASGPTSGASMDIKLAATKDGKITAAEMELRYQAGAFAGSPVNLGCMTAFACYDVENLYYVAVKHRDEGCV
jgi:CO/xanthine dehydrogenase Mo-binding subunit